MKPKVHFTPGDGKGWALDEDLRQIRLALQNRIRETSAASAEIIHAPFWQNLAMVEPGILERAFVIAQADNPPFFYLKQPEFAAGQSWVDMWVARSTEAFEQFQALGLQAVHIPYTIDPKLFFSIEDKKSLRHEFGIPEDAYVIANFHRDTEGADLKTPKFQKAPEMMVEVLKRVRDAGVPFHVLLAGPRRHWIRSTLESEGVPFTFIGKSGISGDDFGKNILSREKLNRLYNAADLHLVPSRWEGGPQSAMEAAACRLKQLCPPIGVARDILEPASFFESVAQAAERIIEDILHGALNSTVEPQFHRWNSFHTTTTLQAGLHKLYDELPDNEAFQAKKSLPKTGKISDGFAQLFFTIRRRTRKPEMPSSVRWNHLPGRNADLDEIMEIVRQLLEELKIETTNSNGAGIEIAGWPIQDIKTPRRIFQWIVSGMPEEEILRGATLVAPAVQDVLNLRSCEIPNPAVVLPVPLKASGDTNAPLVVALGDKTASLQVWRAIAAGRPVFHPKGMAYGEQVFWGGVAYSSPSLVSEASESFYSLPAPGVPDANPSLKNLRKLLSL